MAESDQNQWIEGRAKIVGAKEHILPGRHDYNDQWYEGYYYISDYDCIFDYPFNRAQIKKTYDKPRWKNLKKAKKEGTKIPIKNLAHFTSEANANGIITSKGFKGGMKKINEEESVSLSWWSPKFENRDINLVRDTLNGALKPFYGNKDVGLENQFATSGAFQPPEIYGKVFFKYTINELCEHYITYRDIGKGNQIQFRILGTYVYACEIMYAVLVCIDGDQQFAEYPAVPGDGKNEAVVTRNNRNWVWRPRATSTTITRLAGFKKIPQYRRWEHVAFAFYLPNGVFNPPELQAHRHELHE